MYYWRVCGGDSSENIGGDVSPGSHAWQFVSPRASEYRPAAQLEHVSFAFPIVALKLPGAQRVHAKLLRPPEVGL